MARARRRSGERSATRSARLLEERRSRPSPPSTASRSAAAASSRSAATSFASTQRRASASPRSTSASSPAGAAHSGSPASVASASRRSWSSPGRQVDAEEALRTASSTGIADPVLDHALEVAGKLAIEPPRRADAREAAAQPLAGRARTGGGGVRRPCSRARMPRKGSPRSPRSGAALHRRGNHALRRRICGAGRVVRDPCARASSRRSGCRRRDGRYSHHARLRRAGPADGRTTGGVSAEGLYRGADRRDLGAGDGRARRAPFSGSKGFRSRASRTRARGPRWGGSAAHSSVRARSTTARLLGRGGAPVPARHPGDQRSLKRTTTARRCTACGSCRRASTCVATVSSGRTRSALVNGSPCRLPTTPSSPTTSRITTGIAR